MTATTKIYMYCTATRHCRDDSNKNAHVYHTAGYKAFHRPTVGVPHSAAAPHRGSRCVFIESSWTGVANGVWTLVVHASIHVGAETPTSRDLHKSILNICDAVSTVQIATSTQWVPSHSQARCAALKAPTVSRTESLTPKALPYCGVKSPAPILLRTSTSLRTDACQ